MKRSFKKESLIVVTKKIEVSDTLVKAAQSGFNVANIHAMRNYREVDVWEAEDIKTWLKKSIFTYMMASGLSAIMSANTSATGNWLLTKSASTMYVDQWVKQLNVMGMPAKMKAYLEQAYAPIRTKDGTLVVTFPTVAPTTCPLSDGISGSKMTFQMNKLYSSHANPVVRDEVASLLTIWTPEVAEEGGKVVFPESGEICLDGGITRNVITGSPSQAKMFTSTSEEVDYIWSPLNVLVINGISYDVPSSAMLDSEISEFWQQAFIEGGISNGRG